MRKLTRRRLYSAFCLVCIVFTGSRVLAQTQAAPSSSFDPAALLKSLASADAPAANALLDHLADEQVPTFIAAFDPALLGGDAKDAIVVHVNAIVRRVLIARGNREEALEQEWDQRTGPPVYKSAGKRSPAWDVAALDALNTNFIVTVEQSAKKFKAALDAGCNDPLVRYYYIRRGVAANIVTPADAFSQYIALLPELDKSAYTPVRKFHARIMILKLALENPDFPDASGVVRRMYHQAIAALPMLGDEKPGPLLVRGDVALLETARSKVGRPLEADFLAISPALHKLLPNHPFPFAFDARFYTDWAWEARGGGWASSVTKEGWTLFKERLKLAERAAITGASIDPLNAECPGQMIQISMGLGYDRPVMEKWFTRAMLADPDNRDACDKKFVYLLPRWCGSAEEEIAFGRECLKTGTVGNRIPLELLEVHLQLAEESGDKDAYLSQSKVWADIEAVYKKFLSDPKKEIALDNLRLDHANYIEYAYKCHQWQTVLNLMDQFKDDVDMEIIGGKALYDFYRKDAAQQLARSHF